MTIENLLHLQDFQLCFRRMTSTQQSILDNPIFDESFFLLDSDRGKKCSNIVSSEQFFPKCGKKKLTFVCADKHEQGQSIDGGFFSV